MGLALRLVDAYKGRKVEMEITLSNKDMKLLDAMLRHPSDLPMVPAGMFNDRTGGNFFKAASYKEAEDFSKLTRMFEKRILIHKPEEKDKDDKVTKPESYDYPKTDPVVLKLVAKYYPLLKNLVAYYEPIGLLPQFSVPYVSLRRAIEQTNEAEDDPWDEKPVDKKSDKPETENPKP